MKKSILFITLFTISFGIKAQITDTGGNVGIGTTSPNAKLDVNGTIQAGLDATTGGIFLAQKYASNNYLGTISSNYSSGFITIGYGAAGKANSGSNGQLFSTFDNFSAHRGAIRVGDGSFEFLSTNSPTQATIETELSVASRFYISNNGKIGIGTTNVNVGNSPDPGRKLLVDGGITLKSGSRLSYDPNYYIHAYSEFNSTIPEARFLNYGYYGHRWMTRNGNAMVITGNNNNVGIGTTTPDSKLSVNGKIHAKEVKVDLTGWPDYVFTPTFKLPTLKEVEKHIKHKGHLKDIPSAKEVAKNGILLGEMNKKLLQKIEELTLYAIQQEKKINEQTEKMKKLEALENKFNLLLTEVEKLKRKN